MPPRHPQWTHFRLAQFVGVALAVEQEVVAAPVGEGGHGRFGVAAAAGGFAQLVEQPRGRRQGRSRGESVVAPDSPPGQEAGIVI
jgi:hypothetical protein